MFSKYHKHCNIIINSERKRKSMTAQFSDAYESESDFEQRPKHTKENYKSSSKNLLFFTGKIPIYHLLITFEILIISDGRFPEKTSNATASKHLQLKTNVGEQEGVTNSKRNTPVPGLCNVS